MWNTCKARKGRRKAKISTPYRNAERWVTGQFSVWRRTGSRVWKPQIVSKLQQMALTLGLCSALQSQNYISYVKMGKRGKFKIMWLNNQINVNWPNQITYRHTLKVPQNLSKNCKIYGKQIYHFFPERNDVISVLSNTDKYICSSLYLSTHLDNWNMPNFGILLNCKIFITFVANYLIRKLCAYILRLRHPHTIHRYGLLLKLLHVA